MNKLLAKSYDFYNEHMLRGQNMDIDYYIRELQNYQSKNILVVGAGTGRVAIPIFKDLFVDALDIDQYRLQVLQEKCPNIVCYNMDICNETPNKEYDAIIFPYSTIQLLGNEENIALALLNCSKILALNGVLIFDASESFNYKPDVDRMCLFEDYSKDIKSKISVYYQAKRFAEYIRFITEFYIHTNNITLTEIEQYLYYDKNRMSELVNYSFNIVKIDNGYQNDLFLHKHLYHCKRR